MTAKPRVIIKLFTIPFQFYGPNGTLKIKTGLPTSPISQRALITHGPLITKIPAFDPDWSFSAKCCQSVIIVYLHNCLKANLKHCRKDDWYISLCNNHQFIHFFAWCLLKEILKQWQPLVDTNFCRWRADGRPG